MRTKFNHIGLVLLIAAIPIVGYAVMHTMVLIVPLGEDTTVTQVLISAFIIGLGLAIPYWMLKLGFHTAHLENPEEREISLRDLPKDRDQLERPVR